jgi:aminoglycoside phosphotransferase (APT) family kinase protein
MPEQIDEIDESKLSEYLEIQVSGFKGPLTVHKFSGGQSNPTFRIDAASGQYVLRRQPPGKLLKSAHAVDREHRVLKALQDSEVPVAKVYHLCDDPQVIGSMFYLMEFCDGIVHWKSSLEDVADNQTRQGMYDEMNRVLAAIHSVDLERSGLLDYGKPGNYFQRQIDRWTKQYKASELASITEMDELIRWLECHVPDDDGKLALVHGDFKLDNLMFSKDNQHVIATLDWELSTLGHPYADLAYQCMCQRLPPSPVPNALGGLMGVDTASLGIPSEEEYVAAYCKRMGIEGIDHWSFYLRFSFFRLAAIAQGVAKRAVDGNASSKQAAATGAMVKPLAQLALATDA